MEVASKKSQNIRKDSSEDKISTVGLKKMNSFRLSSKNEKIFK
jgi:hypothetical protein